MRGAVLLDLDSFKALDDELGHVAGDEVLAWVAKAAAGVLRPGDVLGRLGGDELAAVLPGADADEAEEVAERVRAALAERIGASAGSASFPADAEDLDVLLCDSDARLYADKRDRRDAPHARVA